MPSSDQGALSGRYTLIPRTLIFLTHNDQLLLIKGAPSKRLWANLYNGVGGHIERGEDVLSAALRELWEETGVSNADLRLCGVVIIETGQESGIGLYILKGELPSNQQISTLSSEGRPEWVALEDIDRLPLVEDLPILLPRVLKMRPAEPPFSAYYFYNEDGQLQISFGPSKP